MRRPSQKTLLRVVLGVSVVACTAGIVYAVWYGRAADGGRGGAVAVAISFAALFASRNTPRDVLEMTDPAKHGSAAPAELAEGMRRLRTAMATLIDSQATEKVYLTASSVGGTLVWGFGDLIAAALGAAP